MPSFRAPSGSSLAERRIVGHALIDAVMQRHNLSRDGVYRRMSVALKLPMTDCHFGHMDEATCDRAIEALTQMNRNDP